MNKKYLPITIILLVLLLDQGSKIWIKTHMRLGEEYVITQWFRIHFTENPGMAFGMMLPGIWGKLFLSTFRLIAVSIGTWYIVKLVKEKAHNGYIAACSLIYAGALGNMIDGTFYGVLFSESTFHSVATFLPAEGGYSSWMQGLVVDMLWFPLFHGFFPDWVPFWGGEYFEFFRFIFNIADAAITVGVFIILVFQKRFFPEEKPVADNEPQNPVNA